MIGWIRRNIVGRSDYVRRPDGDFGTAFAPGAAALDPAGHDLEERLVADSERIDQVREAVETALHPHQAQRIDVGGTATGFVRGVLVRVLAHVIAQSDRPDPGPPRSR